MRKGCYFKFASTVWFALKALRKSSPGLELSDYPGLATYKIFPLSHRMGEGGTK